MEELVIALDIADGKELWKVPCGPAYRNDYGSGPRSTPAVDGKFVYVQAASGPFVCIDADKGTITIDGKTYAIAPFVQDEVEHIRTYSLYTPRDFDVSPFFAIVKPTLAAGFDYRTVQWGPPEVTEEDLRHAEIVPLLPT